MELFIELAGDILFDAVKDTLYLIPFLYVTYLFMEWLEHKAPASTEETVAKAGVAGPFVGALLGVIPQCGFSSAASTLYAGRVITVGTLIAVYLSTSDEMLPIFIAGGVSPVTIISILGVKVLVGLCAGFAIDFAVRLSNKPRERFRIHELCIEDNCGCNEECEICKEHPENAYLRDEEIVCECEHEHNQEHEHEHFHHEEGDHDHTHECACGHNHEHHHHHSTASLFKSALGHTVRVGIFVFLITLAINIAFALLGEEALSEFVANNEVLSVFASALCGLIPNCAASVAIAQLYVEGALGSGAMMSGLLVSAGVGLLLLFRTNRPHARNFAIIGMLYAIGVGVGLLINMFGVVF